MTNLLTSAFAHEGTDTILLSIMHSQGHDKIVEDDPDYVIGVTAVTSVDTTHPGLFKLTIKTFPIAIPELHRINEQGEVLIPVKELDGEHLLTGVSPEFAERYKLWTVNPTQILNGAIEQAEQELGNSRTRLNSAVAIYEMLTAASLHPR